MKKRLLLGALIVFTICFLAACGADVPLVEPEPVEPPPVEEPIEISDPEPEPAEDGEWSNWIYDDHDHWWTKPGWGIATTVDGTFWLMDLYFNAPARIRPLAEEMAITHYLSFLGIGGFEYHTFPLISAAAMGDLGVRSQIIEVLANRLIAMREADLEKYNTYMAIFSDRGLVYDEVTRDIFLELEDMLTRVPRLQVYGMYAQMSVSDILDVFTERAYAEPVEEMLPTLIPVENMYMFLSSPAAFLEAIHEAAADTWGWELEVLARHIALVRFFDPVLYVFYHDFLGYLEGLELSEGAQDLRAFLLTEIELFYSQLT